MNTLSTRPPIPVSVQVLWPREAIARYMYKAFPDALLRKPVVTGGVRVSIPFLEDLLNRAELKAWMEWEPAELEFQPYYWSKRWRYAGMGRQERAQMDTDKAFEQVLGTGIGKDRMWQAALEWRSQVSEGAVSFPTDEDAPERDATFAAIQTMLHR